MAAKTKLTKGLYRGFSSFEFQRIKQFEIIDIELVKLDLLNHIFTLRGERVMMPTFGTSIPELTFEPMTEELVESVEDELREVFDFDPRVQLIQMDTIPYYDEGRLESHVRLFYVELGTVDDMNLNITFEGQ